MIEIIKRNVKEKKPRKIKEFAVGSWVHVEDPTEKEQDFLVKDLKLDQDLLKDSLDPYEVPRVEVDNEDLYMFTRIPFSDTSRVRTSPLLIVFRKDSVVTISRKKVMFDNKLFSDPDLFTTQKTRLILQIFAEINRLYNTNLMDISRNVRSTSVDIESIDNKDIIKLLRYENTLNDFLGALIPMSTILEGILSGKFLALYEKDRDLVEDLSLANKQLVELASSSMKNIVNIREVYSTIMTNNLNRVIKLLTAVTVILTVPTVIASIYGMNVKLPLAESPWAFWEVIGGTVVLSLLVSLYFIRKKWF